VSAIGFNRVQKALTRVTNLDKTAVCWESLPLGNCPYSPTSTRVTHLNPPSLTSVLWMKYIHHPSSLSSSSSSNTIKMGFGVWTCFVCTHDLISFTGEIQPKFDLILAKIRFPIILRIFPLKRLPKNRQI
jgi:hypothetical protein